MYLINYALVLKPRASESYDMCSREQWLKLPYGERKADQNATVIKGAPHGWFVLVR